MSSQLSSVLIYGTWRTGHIDGLGGKKTPLGITLLHTRLQKETSRSHPHVHRASTTRMGPSRFAHVWCYHTRLQ